ncbi:MAG: hypothetical protein RL514_2636 [Verrucomicrobiota bacterium]|jgi:chromosome segregation ATPase
MNNKTAVVVLVSLSVLLGVGLLMRHNAAVETKKKDDTTIASLEGDVKKTTGELTSQKQVNEALGRTNELVRANLAAKTAEAQTLAAKVEATTAEVVQTKGALTKSQAETKAAEAATKQAQAATEQAKAATEQAKAATEQAKAATEQAKTATKKVEEMLVATEAKAKADAAAAAAAAAARYAALDKTKAEEIAKREASIKDLQQTRDQLNAKVAELNGDITKLKSTIGTLNTRIAFVEGELQVTKDDKAFLTKELGRMQGERTEMERKMNDLAFLKEQMSTIKSDEAIARRVDWMRRGMFLDERKGATLLVDGLKPLATMKPTTTRGSQLNVEVHRDGTVTIKPPTSTAPASAAPAAEKSVTVGPEFPATPAPKKK